MCWRQGWLETLNSALKDKVFTGASVTLGYPKIIFGFSGIGLRCQQGGQDVPEIHLSFLQMSKLLITYLKISPFNLQINLTYICNIILLVITKTQWFDRAPTLQLLMNNTRILKHTTKLGEDQDLRLGSAHLTPCMHAEDQDNVISKKQRCIVGVSNPDTVLNSAAPWVPVRKYHIQRQRVTNTQWDLV